MNLTSVIRHRYFDANGNPLAGGKIYTYQAGTTTPQVTYTDSGGLTPNTNPIILDANGETNIWVDPALSYKMVLKDSTDVTQWTVDNIVGLLTANSVATASLQDGSVTTPKLANNAVDTTKLASDASIDGNRAVNTNHIRDAAITAAKLNASSVDGQTAITASVAADELLIWSSAASALRKITTDNFKKSPTIQKFTSGSGTYTTATGARWIRVRMVGGGGGGSGAGTSATNGGNGSATTFGTTLLSANGGGGGVFSSSPGTAGTASLGTGPIGFALSGALGQGGGLTSSGGIQPQGGSGGGTPFGGGAGGGALNVAGYAAVANTGAGGGGAGGPALASFSGTGGSSGGFVDAIIISPAATYAYTIGTGGSAGTGSINGGAGGSGMIVVEEYY